MKTLLLPLFLMFMVLTINAQSCPDNNHPHMIDLGLPSGTKWACCNVGADKPEGYGGYYAWGETEEKTTYNWSTYIHCDGSDTDCNDLGSDIAGTQYDAAHVKWGGSWVMPSSEQQDELRDNCTYKWTTVNGVKGKKFTSQINGESIFMPAAGYRWDADLQYAEIYGFFWSSTQGPSNSNYSNFMYFDSRNTNGSIYIRSAGNTVRPVISGTNNYAQSCPDNNHPHAIDLGLPSGTKWACCNVGADKPEGHGGYYAWGETEEKETYNEVTYQYCTGEDPNSYGWYGQNIQYQDLGSDIAGTQYDVAHVKWGGSWVMPSLDEIKELYNYCTSNFTIMNGFEGQKFTSKNNGRTIFLPAADYYSPSLGQYWSSTQEPTNLKWAYGLYFFPYESNWCTYSHPLGLTVRPVISGTTNINLLKSSSLAKSNQAVYNLYGIKVADSIDNMNSLTPGIYIVNGKKMVIK